jgi:WD40 repeat protein
VTALDLDHPWPGPDSFRTHDAAFFRGRDSEIKQLLQLVRRERSVVLYGASGLGKTSLIHAGLIPRLGDDYFAVPIRISYVAGAPSVSEQLQTEILRSRVGPGMPRPRPHRTAWELLHLRDEPIEGAQPLLIFDQFEELFTIGAGTPQASELLEELKALIESVPPASVRERLERHPEDARSLSFQRRGHRVLISIREDFLYGLESLRAQLPSIIHNRYRIGPLGGGNALEVVLQRPLEAPGTRAAAAAPLVEPDVAELIVRTVAAAPDDRPLEALEVEPALLSILCSELARRRSPGMPITRALVTGNRTDIISSFYERALHDAPDAVRAYLEDQLVTATGFRTSAVVDEALTVPGFTSELLSDLVNKRLLRVIERPKGKWLELTHDILTEIAAHSRALRRERQRLQAERAARDQKERAERLAHAARDRARRIRAALVLGGMVLAVVVLSSLYRAALMSHRAEVIEHEAAVRRYETEQRSRHAADEAKRTLRRQVIDASLREGNYREALVQLAAVVNEERDAGWARALVGDLLSRRAWPVPAAPMFPEGPFTWLSCNRSGTRCAAAYRDGRVLVRGDLSRDLVTGQTGFGDLAMSEDGTGLLLVPEQPGTAIHWTISHTDPAPSRLPVEETSARWGASADSRVAVLPKGAELTIWQLGAREPTSTTIRRSLGNALFALSRDGKWVGYQKDQGAIALASARGAERGDVSVDHRLGRYLDFDPGSKTLLLAQTDGTVRRWTVPGLRALTTLRAGGPVVEFTFDWTGDQVALQLDNGGVELWRAPWHAPHVLLWSSHGVMRVSFAPDAQWLAISTRDGTVSTWSSSGTPLGEPVHLAGLAFAAALNDRGLLAVSLGGTSGRWTVPTPRRPRQYVLGEPVQSAWLQSEEAFVAQGQSKQFTQLGNDIQTTPLMRHPLYLSRDRRHAATTYTTGLALREGMPSRLYIDDKDKLLELGNMDYARFSADGTRIITSGTGKGYLVDVVTRQQIGQPIDHVSDVWLNDDGTILATTANDVGLTLWQCVSDGSHRKLADVDTQVVSNVAFDHASNAIVIVTASQARVWSLRDRRFTDRAVAHEGPITAVAFSPDGRWIATGSADKRARIWEAASGLPASDWFEHDGSVTVVDFSPSGRKLLTGSSDGSVRVWDLAGIADATDQERHWLGRTAEILSGMHIDPGTGEAVPEPRAFEAVEALRRDIDRVCPEAGKPGCDSATSRLIRTVIDNRNAAPSPIPHAEK